MQKISELSELSAKQIELALASWLSTFCRLARPGLAPRWLALPTLAGPALWLAWPCPDWLGRLGPALAGLAPYGNFFPDYGIFSFRLWQLFFPIPGLFLMTVSSKTCISCPPELSKSWSKKVRVGPAGQLIFWQARPPQTSRPCQGRPASPKPASPALAGAAPHPEQHCTASQRMPD